MSWGGSMRIRPLKFSVYSVGKIERGPKEAPPRRLTQKPVRRASGATPIIASGATSGLA